jgi:hypothetical protein
MRYFRFDCSRVFLGPPVFATTASLRFQPIKRPQLPNQKPKSKPPFTKPNPITPKPELATSANNAAARLQAKSTLADWASTVDDDDDINGFYSGAKRQRGGRKKRKKNRDGPEMMTNWDDIYDPSRPNNYEEYKQSDEKIREVRDWKDRLYAHRMARQPSSDYDSDDDYHQPKNRKLYEGLPQRKILTVSQDNSLLRLIILRLLRALTILRKEDLIAIEKAKTKKSKWQIQTTNHRPLQRQYHMMPLGKMPMLEGFK